MKLSVGDKAPDFTSTNQDGNEVTLADLKGQKVVMFFYPKDDSPGCTKEACNLRDNFKKFVKMGYTIVGVSPDNEKKHRKFIDKYELQYTLLADPEKKIINDYGLWGPKKFMGREITGVYRTTLLLDEEGTITHILDKVKTKEHSDQIFTALAES